MNIKIGIIGLGYVGLPLARLFATKYPVVGFDINTKRVVCAKRVTRYCAAADIQGRGVTQA